MSALDACVEAASLASGAAVPLRTFTASVQAGVLAMRRASEPWAFAVALLRSGLCTSPRLSARVVSQQVDGQTTLQFDLRMDPSPEDWPELSGLLDAALNDDALDPAPQRWRSLIGAAVNGALASEPRWVELHTPAGARRWAWSSGASEDRDPYEVQRLSTEVPEGGVSLRVSHQSRGVAAIWARVTGRNEPLSEVSRLWSVGLGRTVSEEALAEGVLAQRPQPAGAVRFGDAGHWWRAESGGLHLRRDGVRVAELSELVKGPSGEAFHGDLDAPKLKLDADGRRPHIDDAWHELVAWLHVSAQAEALEIPKLVIDGRGHSRSIETLGEADEVVFAWPHRIDAERGELWAVAPLTPPQLVWLRENTAARFIPASVLAGGTRFDRVDSTALEAGSVGPVEVGTVADAHVQAYVHRHPIAAEGVVQVHAFGRRILRGKALELPGVTVVAVVPDGEATVEQAAVVAKAACERTRSKADRLTQAALEDVVDETSRMRTPWLKHRWEQLGPLDTALAYSPQGTRVALTWRDEPFLSCTVGHGRNGVPHTGACALRRLRDVGGIVIAHGGARWHTLESELPAWEPWILTPRGLTLLKKIVGDWGLWRMPMVAEAQLRPQDLASQTHVRLSLAGVAELRENLRGHGRAAEWARLALLAHVLWARAVGEATFGLEIAALFFAYDPQSAAPYSRVSLEQIESGTFSSVVPIGAGHRELRQPVIEAEPAFASALVQLGLLGTGVVTAPTRGKIRPVAAKKTERRVWLRQPVADATAVGALTLGEGPPGVELWKDGLRSRTLRLPPPYRGLSGRVWLQGQVSETALGRLLYDAAGVLADNARRAVLLAVPGSARARALEAFVESMPAALEPASAVRRVASVLGSDRFAATLRFALGRAAVVEVSRVSWSLLRDDEGLELVRLGGLHPLIRAAREDGADASAIGAAALAALFELHRAERLDLAGFDEGLSRVLAALE